MEWSWRFTFIWGSILPSLRVTHQAANVALGGVAVQSSRWNHYYNPYRVIDGKPYSQNSYGSCTATSWEDNPWWRVDLRRPYNISSIKIIQRSDCCMDELEGAEIRIGDSLENGGNNNPRCAVISVITDVIVAFSCGQMKGRYVNIFIPGVQKRLQLCEVQVYTATTHITGANVALSGAAVQSSLLDPLYQSSLVIDGKPYSNFAHQSCTSTLYEENPWWRLDMRGLYDISFIEVIRRSDWVIKELEGAEIRIGNSLENDGNNNPRCAVITVTSDITMTYNCSPMKGRYVNIVLPGVKRILQLCEVKVYATTHMTEDFKKRWMVRISADFDMRDPDIQQQIMSQLELDMKTKSINDFKICWMMSFIQGRKSTVGPTSRR